MKNKTIEETFTSHARWEILKMIGKIKYSERVIWSNYQRNHANSHNLKNTLSKIINSYF